ncbi:MAG: sugar ABC transporter permease [Clostridia bacterium]|nr:sugar ABC transporter permease [Clostridia bacterium]
MKLSKNKGAVSVSATKRKMKIRNDINGWLFLLPTVIMLYILIWRPTVLGAVWSFFKMHAYTVGDFIGLDNFKMVINHSRFWQMMSNTLMYVFWSLVIGFLPPAIIAIMINEVVYFKQSTRILIYVPTIIPGIVAYLMWTYIYAPDNTGLLNMLLSKIGIAPYEWLNDAKFTIAGLNIQSAWKNMGSAMLLYYACLQGASIELYEAAILDGAGMFRRAWTVTRPALSATLLLNFVNQIISVFQALDAPLVMTGGGPNGASANLGFQLYQYAFNSGGRGTGQAMALGVIIFVVLLVATLFYFWINKRIEDSY